MAENKKSFLLYCDIVHTVKKLSNEQAGELFKHILSYVNDENPITENVVIDLVFEPIKQQLKRDLRRYESICDRNKKNGEKGGRPKNKPKKPIGLFGNPKNPDEPKKADIDNDIDIDINKDTIVSKTWRNNFEIYLADCEKAYDEIYYNDEILKEQGKFNPNVDIKKSIEKGFTNYWGTEAGWKKKKASRTTDIDWKTTIINSISFNKVYYTREQQQKMSV